MPFPGVLTERSIRYTSVLGVSPGVVMIEAIPQATGIAAIGDAVITDGFTSLTLPGCAVKKKAMRWGGTGQIAMLYLHDRRWRWKYSPIRGVYNQRADDGSLIASTERTPQQLATLLFTAMGEPFADVSALPNDDRPFVKWDSTRADRILQDFCLERGCIPTLDPATNLAGIVRLGDASSGPGAASNPNPLDLQTVDDSADASDLPGALRVAGNNVIFGSILELEAVGLDSDGSIKPIDDLSYKPADGWSFSAGPEFEFLEVAEEYRALAKRTVFKWYRVKQQVGGGVTPPGYDGTVDEWEDLLPIYGTTVETDGVSGLEPVVFGRFISPDIGYELTTANYSQVFTAPFTLNQDAGIVKFGKAVYYVEDGATRGANLYLRCHYSITASHGLKVRHEFTTSIYPQGGAGTLQLDRPDIVRFITGQYTITEDDPPVYSGVTDNRTEADTQCQQVALAWSAANFPAAAQAQKYRFIQPVGHSGVIRQITWCFDHEGGQNASYTVVSINSETDPYIPPLRELNRRIRSDDESNPPPRDVPRRRA